MRNNKHVFNNLFNPNKLRKLPKEAFYDETIKQRRLEDPYIDNVFKIKPYIANNSYICNIARSSLYENPIDNLNQVTYINNVPIEEESKYIQKNVNNLQLLNMYRHKQDFLFIRLEDIPKFYKDFKDFLDYYHMVLSTSYNYVNIDKNLIQDIETMLSEFYNQFKYLIDPDKEYEDNNLLNFGSQNSLFNFAINKTNEEYVRSTGIQQTITPPQQIYERTKSTNISLNGKQRVDEKDALPEINFNLNRTNSVDIKF